MHIKWFMRGYRATLWLTVAVSLGVAIAVFLLLLGLAPHIILYWMNVLSPISRAFRDLIWFFFPEITWIRTAGEWIGLAARWALTKTSARQEVIGRIYIDGFIFITFMTWITGLLLKLWVNYKVGRWFNTRYEIVRRQGHIPAPKPPPQASSPPPAPAKEATAEPFEQFERAAKQVVNTSGRGKLPKAPQLKIPHDSSS